MLTILCAWISTDCKIITRTLKISSQQSDIASALNLLELGIALSLRFEVALELKTRYLLHFRQFKNVANMLQD